MRRALFDAWGRGRNWSRQAGQRNSLLSPPTKKRNSTPARLVHAATCHQAKRPASRHFPGHRRAPRRNRTRLSSLYRADASLFEFSLGVPLSQVPLVHSAHLLLRWLDRPLPENEIDWLFPRVSCSRSEETDALHATMRALRGRGLARPEWTLLSLARQFAARKPAALMASSHEPVATRLSTSNGKPPSIGPLACQSSSAAGLPGERTFSSAEFQAWQRWTKRSIPAVHLGFDGHRITWSEFLTALARILDDTLFAPESSDAPIQIAGPAESAGLTADAIWFLGADEEAWPATGSTHPLLPTSVQREPACPMPRCARTGNSRNPSPGASCIPHPSSISVLQRARRRYETRPSRLIAQLGRPASASSRPLFHPAHNCDSQFPSPIQPTSPFLPPKSMADRLFSPRNRSARSRHSPRRGLAREVGTRPNSVSRHRSADSCFTRCCTPSGRDHRRACDRSTICSPALTCGLRRRTRAKSLR